MTRREPWPVRVLIRIGLTRYRPDGRLHFPIHVDSWLWWRLTLRGTWHERSLTRGPFPAIGVFRNLPGVIKWVPGRLLPRRWGFHVFGLEIGDRG